MVRLADKPSIDEMLEVAHGWNEAISKCGHMADSRAFSGLIHLPGFGEIHGQRFFAKDMFASLGGLDRDLSMKEIRGCNDHGVDVIAFEDFLIIRTAELNFGDLASAFENFEIGVAESDHLDIRAQGQAGDVVLKRDTAAPNNRNTDRAHKRP
jgi:hypothetical protein